MVRSGAWWRDLSERLGDYRSVKRRYVLPKCPLSFSTWLNDYLLSEIDRFWEDAATPLISGIESGADLHERSEGCPLLA